MDLQTAKSINNLSKRLFDMEQKLESFLLDKHNKNRDKIETQDGGIMDIADAVSLHDEVLCELAQAVSNIIKGESSNG